MDDERTYPLTEKIHGKPVSLHIDYAGRATFQVTLEEGNTLKHQILENLRTNVDNWYKTRARKKRKKLDIPFLLWTNSDDYISGRGKTRYGYPGSRKENPHQFLDCKVTSIHASSGNPIMKIGEGKAKQDNWISGVFFPVLSPEKRAECKRLQDAKIAAAQEWEHFVEHHAIGESTSSFMHWLKTKHKIDEEK